MVKHTQTIRLFLFGYFVGLALKGLSQMHHIKNEQKSATTCRLATSTKINDCIWPILPDIKTPFFVDKNHTESIGSGDSFYARPSPVTHSFFCDSNFFFNVIFMNSLLWLRSRVYCNNCCDQRLESKCASSKECSIFSFMVAKAWWFFLPPGWKNSK